VYTHIHTRIYMRSHVHTHVRTRMHTHSPSHIHTHTHTPTNHHEGRREVHISEDSGCNVLVVHVYLATADYTTTVHHGRNTLAVTLVNDTGVVRTLLRVLSVEGENVLLHVLEELVILACIQRVGNSEKSEKRERVCVCVCVRLQDEMCVYVSLDE
jgi:hypothetical protein